MPGGPSAISRPNATSTSGSTASTCRPASKTDAQCLLVIIGATPEGKKELVGLTDGVRESVQSWRELLLDLRRRGLSIGPELAVADGALGFWQALEEVWPKTRGQRCWVHKTANVLNKLPKSLQAKAKRALQDIWMAETKKEALVAFDAFVETYGVKYDKAVACLVKDRDALLAFYDFPAEHWKHLRTTNPIESTFATIRHRTVRSKGCLSNKTALAMIFKLAQAAEKSWRRLDGHHHLPKVIRGVTFTDGIEVVSRKLKPLPPDPARHQHSAIPLQVVRVVKDGHSILEGRGLQRVAASKSPCPSLADRSRLMRRANRQSCERHGPVSPRSKRDSGSGSRPRSSSRALAGTGVPSWTRANFSASFDHWPSD